MAMAAGWSEAEVLTVQSFYVGDRLRHARRGTGTVAGRDATAIYVSFDSGEHHHYRDKSLALGKIVKGDAPPNAFAVVHHPHPHVAPAGPS